MLSYILAVGLIMIVCIIPCTIGMYLAIVVGNSICICVDMKLKDFYDEWAEVEKEFGL